MTKCRQITLGFGSCLLWVLMLTCFPSVSFSRLGNDNLSKAAYQYGTNSCSYGFASSDARLADSPITFDEFTRISFAKERPRLERLADGMKKDFPEHIAYIVKWYPKGTATGILKKRERDVISHLTVKGRVSINRVFVVFAIGEKERTVYYLIPPDRSNRAFERHFLPVA